MPVVFDEVEATVEPEPAPPQGERDEEEGEQSAHGGEEFLRQLMRRRQREARLSAD